MDGSCGNQEFEHELSNRSIALTRYCSCLHGSSCMHFLQSSIQYIQSFPDLLIGGDQRHQQTNHVAKRPGGHHKQAAAVAGSQNEPGLRVGRFLGRAVDPDDLESDANVFFNSDTLDSGGRRGLSLRKSLRL